MKLFQQLLVAPAALGLLAPLAANAAELNINEVSDYASGSEVQNFSDVYPTDWAFQALTSLAERHGCAVSNPSGSITRYEAASLLDKCLGNVAQVSEEERRLINEFAPELALIKGRVDGLESRVSEFEAGQFSKTTTLTGKSAFIIGSVDSDTLGATDDALTMEYMYQMNMNTSFTGRDKLYARIKSGNVNGYFDNKADGTYLSATGQGDACITVTSNTTCTDDYGYLQVDKLWYEFPLGDNFRGWIGPRIENYYMTASSPSIYKPVMKQFALGGNGPVYGSSTSGGFGLAWTQTQDDPSEGRWEASAGYTSKESANDTLDEGLFGSNAPTALLTKVGYGTSRWQVSLATAFKQNNWEDSYFATNQAMDRADGSSETAIGLRAYWKPDETGALPAVQVGWDTTTVDNNGDLVKDATGWMIGLGWKDVLVDGNKAGVAIGSRMSVKKMGGEGASVDGDPFSWEAYYTFKINDNVSVTPALFGNEDPGTDMNDNTGYVVLTEFRF
tara:strand:+ start:13432 stop:14940 length:1509 start_codon:yes stop_codon:yes gene_type:complete